MLEQLPLKIKYLHLNWETHAYNYENICIKCFMKPENSTLHRVNRTSHISEKCKMGKSKGKR